MNNKIKIQFKIYKSHAQNLAKMRPERVATAIRHNVSSALEML